MTGSAIAIPLLGAGSASAAEANVWDRVAECESGGAWSADFGNGFYGGLQFSQETWETYGGTAYAPTADLASRSQQIAVAEKVVADQGPQAWPACGPLAGLTGDSADTGVDPGLLPLPGQSDAPADEPSTGPSESTEPAESENTSDSSGEADKEDRAGTAEPSGDVTGQPAPKDGDATDPAGTGTSDASEGATGADPADDAAGGSGKHRGEPADDETESGDTGEARETGRHASRGDDSARNGVDEANGPGAYTVQPGDNLCDIAAERKVPGGWPALYEANETIVGSDPDLILPGQQLDLGLK
ncbi:transglycosylase family protein [Streptomyces sp. NPDC006283]|uniref:transglycosylase family protein n=1 Tax=Streptomyces sp. NPDC006283 TaxID=3156741 RepID=UPI0033BEC168